MSDPMDERLAALRSGGEMPAGLDDIEDRVLAALAARAERRNAMRMTGFAAVGALVIGMASTMLPARQAVAAPFDAVVGTPALAPSSLLFGTAR